MITILGATGKVGRKIVENLSKRDEKMVLVARHADRLRPFIGEQATAMAGDALDTEFLVQAFKGSDTVFTLIPPNFTIDKFLPYARKMGESIARALEISGVSHVVNLSSIGAELAEGTGPIVGLHEQEERLNKIRGLSVLHLRCAFFMENLRMNIDSIKSKGINSSPYRGDLKFPMIATKDIAAYAAERLIQRDFAGSSVRYLLGKKDLSMNEATRILARKIGKPDLAYVMMSYDDAVKGFISLGISPDVSRLYAEMSRAFNEGLIRTEKRSAENTTGTSFEQFCDEVFVPAYREQQPRAA